MPTKNENVVEIIRFDDFGRGIGYINNKIIFIKKAIPGDICTVKITKENKKVLEGEILEFVTKSRDRIDSTCPFFNKCDGCSFRNISYSRSLDIKKDKVINAIRKFAKLDVKPELILCKNPKNYRNKVGLKIDNGETYYYEFASHKKVKINNCPNAQNVINDFIKFIPEFKIRSGEIIIRGNYNDEILVIITTNQDLEINDNLIKKINKNIRIAGILLNGRIIYGDNSFIEIIDGLSFKVSHDSFFQVNRQITSELFKIVKKNVEKSDYVLDLCSGVGTLSIVSAHKAKYVYGIEIVENAVKDACVNAKMNKCENISFLQGDAFSKIVNYKDKVNTIIVDPPRCGLKEKSIDYIIDSKINKIIYISCNPITLSRDLNYLKDKYQIKKIYVLDMFSYTYHVESVCVLELKN